MARDAQGRIVAETAAALDRAIADLIEAENDLVALEAQVADAITSGDPEQAASLASEIKPLRVRIAELQATVEAARTDEDRRLEAARIAEAHSRVRALKQHSANFGKHVQSLRIAAKDMALAHRHLNDAIYAARAIIGDDDAEWPSFCWVDLERSTPSAELDATVQKLLGSLTATLAGAIATMQSNLPTEEAT